MTGQRLRQRRTARPSPDFDRFADSVARAALQRRTLGVVLVSQILGGAGLAAGVTVGALLAQSMLGGAATAGLPTALFTLGSAGAALAIGRMSQRAGRRTALAAGYAAGSFGALGIVAAAAVNNAWLLFAALVVYGAGTATNLQARYAGTDLATPATRGKAISVALVATTLGAVAGPNLVVASGSVARAVGLPPLTGPFLLAALAYAAAGLVLLSWLRPDPYLVAEVFTAQARGAAAAREGTRAAPDANGRGYRGVVFGAAIMVVSQLAMVAIMTMTPITMQAHGSGLAEVGVVIGIHIGAMYLPSLLTGYLVDRIGRLPVAAGSALFLAAAGTVAATAPADSTPLLGLALALLGLGWNFGLISGTALVADFAPITTRVRTQGSVDLLLALAGAAGGAVSGLVVTALSYPALGWGAVVLALLGLPLVLATGRRLPAVH